MPTREVSKSDNKAKTPARALLLADCKGRRKQGRVTTLSPASCLNFELAASELGTNPAAGAKNLSMDSWPWTNEEEPPFPGLPPLPKVFRDLSPSSLPEKGVQEEIKPLEQESCSSHQNSLTWLHHEMLQLRLVDVALFNQLYTLALEIQDLKELQQETESFFKEEFLTEEGRGLHMAMRTRSAATPFELSI